MTSNPSAICALAAGLTRDRPKATAELLGATWKTEEKIQAAAEKTVADIVQRVRDARRAGGLREVNVSYKAYRQKQIGKGEKAMPYSPHVQHFVRNLFIRAAHESMH